MLGFSEACGDRVSILRSPTLVVCGVRGVEKSVLRLRIKSLPLYRHSGNCDRKDCTVLLTPIVGLGGVLLFFS
jgi:hypothetical protein